jgi:hypothetical protein
MRTWIWFLRVMETIWAVSTAVMLLYIFYHVAKSMIADLCEKIRNKCLLTKRRKDQENGNRVLRQEQGSDRPVVQG